MPTWISAAALVALVAAVELQVRAVEEPYLLHQHGSDYVDYAARTGRFVPGVGRIRSQRQPTPLVRGNERDSIGQVGSSGAVRGRSGPAPLRLLRWRLSGTVANHARRDAGRLDLPGLRKVRRHARTPPAPLMTEG